MMLVEVLRLFVIEDYVFMNKACLSKTITTLPQQQSRSC